MRRYRVFLGAPRVLDSESSSMGTETGSLPHHWHTVSYNAESRIDESGSLGNSVSYTTLNRPLLPLLSPGDIDSASQRISSMYKGVIFREDESDELRFDNEESLAAEDQGGHSPSYMLFLVLLIFNCLSPRLYERTCREI